MRLLAKLSLALLSTVFALALAEIFVRLWLPPPQQIAVIDIAARQRLRDENRKRAEFTVGTTAEEAGTFYIHTAAGRRMRANARVVVRNHRLCKCEVELRTNSLGYRNPELGPKTLRRVLFLGDSITFADYLVEPETFVRRVETDSRSSGMPLETINAGIGAIGLLDELAVLTETGLSTQPDVVVLGFYLNDVQPSPGMRMIPAPAFLRWSHLTQHLLESTALLQTEIPSSQPAAIPLETFLAWKAATAQKFPPAEDGDPRRSPAAFNRRIQEWFIDWGSAWSEDAWRYMLPVFAELKRLAVLHRFELRFVIFPVREQVEADFLYHFPQQRLAEVGLQLDVPVLDLLPSLRDAYQRDPHRPLFYDQCHHTPHGSEIVARTILAFLQQRGT